MTEATRPSPQIVTDAAEAVYRAWRRHLSETEARAQADAFARRFLISIDRPLCPLPAAEALPA